MTTTMGNLKVTASDDIDFEYKFAPVSDLEVETYQDAKTGRTKVKNVVVAGEPIPPTDRFWTSLFSRYGFNSAFFKYFSHDEVFSRISERESNDRMRLCIERGESGNRLLAVSNPNKPLVSFSELHDLLERYGGTDVTYADGLVESNHQPRNNVGSIDIGGDLFEHRFILSCPVDGYGLPNTYLAMLRQICTNGMVAYSKIFRTTLALGKGSDDVSPALVRVLDGFGNDEGYAAFRQRIESSQRSWASVYEQQQLSKLIYKLHAGQGQGIDDVGGRALPKGTKIAQLIEKSRGKFEPISDSAEDAIMQAPIFRAFSELTGEPTRLYGIANPDALSIKRQRTLPVKCTMYDLINFATEVATHYSEPHAARKLQGWVGSSISGEYDMENTRDKFTDFADFHVDSKLGAGLTGHGDFDLN